MSVFRCKMCGGTLEINENQSTAVCNYCGTEQTLPKLEDSRRANLYDRANHFRRNNEFDKAMSIYENILNEDSTDAEAYWSLVLCRYGIEYVEDPATKKRVPTINRAQFTSIFDDDNYKSALANADILQKAIYEAEASAINEIQKGILAISQKEEPFDVFICYKESDNNGRRTHDSVIANDLYHQLTKEGFKVFFSRITLEDKLGVAYEPYIFAALNSAKVMVVLGTKPEYFNAVWVKNEWSRYLALVKHSDGQKMLIPAYRDMDPYDLPEEFSHLQAQDMSKLGFMQDLIHGIKKLATKEAPKAAVKETVVVSSTNANVAPLLKRAFMFLEDGDWTSADEYCEKVLDQDPENAMAYLGKLMAELRVYNKEDLKNQAKPYDARNNYQKALRFADEALQTKLIQDIEYIDARNETARKEDLYQNAQNIKLFKTEAGYLRAIEIFCSLGDYKDSKALIDECKQGIEELKQAALLLAYNDAVRAMKIAATESTFIQASKKFEALGDYKDSKDLMEKCIEKADITRKDAILDVGKSKVNSIRNFRSTSSIKSFEDAIQIFKSVPDWKDSNKQVEFCLLKIVEIKANIEEDRIARQKKIEEDKKKAKKIALISSIATSAVAICIAFVLILVNVIIPKVKYNKAIDLFNEGKYDEAMNAFLKIEDYKDSYSLYKLSCYYYAVAFMNEGKYQEAIDAFQEHPNYKDSELQILNCKYNIALGLMNEGKYEEAIEAFTEIIDHLDSRDKITDGENAIKDNIYNEGITLKNSAKYEEAINVFKSLNGYRDSTAQITTCQNAIKDIKYDAAITLKNEGEYEEAITAFKALNGHKDSASQITTCQNAINDIKYDAAITLKNEGKYEEAITAFKALNGHKDSASQITTCQNAINDIKYDAAITLKNEGKYEEAITAFKALNGHKDSASQITTCKKLIIKATPVGGYITFGKYEQDDNTSNGKEDIEWLVLDKQGNKVLVISKYALDCQRYNTSYTDVTWETCSLRTWLNSTFINSAFSTTEKSVIPTVTVSADKNPSYSTNPGNATQDKVFLLSISEANKYFSSDSARACQATAYAKAQGAYTSSSYGGNCLWWLRSPGSTQDSAARVDGGGDVYERGRGVNVSDGAVRPALWIDLELIK